MAKGLVLSTGRFTETGAGAFDIPGTLNVTGASTLHGINNSSSGLTLVGSLAGVSTLAMTGALSGATTGGFSGAVTAASVVAGALDTSAAATLGLGTVNATTITLGRTGQAVSLPGNASVTGTLGVTGAATLGSVVTGAIDTSAAAVFNLGITNATTITIGRTGQTVSHPGNATVTGTLGVTSSVTAGSVVTGAIDTSAAATLGLGTANATTITIGRTGQTVSFPGNVSVTGTETIVGGTAFGTQISFGPTGVASASPTTYPSINTVFQYSYWTGAAAVTTSGYSMACEPSSAAVGVGDLVWKDANTTKVMRLEAATGVLHFINGGSTYESPAATVGAQQKASASSNFGFSYWNGTANVSPGGMSVVGVDTQASAGATRTNPLWWGDIAFASTTTGSGATIKHRFGTWGAMLADSGFDSGNASSTNAGYDIITAPASPYTAGWTHLGAKNAIGVLVGRASYPIQLAGTVTCTGSLAATSIVSGAFDTSAAATLGLGITNATTITIGRTGQTVSHPGNATVTGTLGVTGAATLGSVVTGAIDTSAAAVFNLGITNATTITIGRTGQSVSLPGNVSITGTGTVGGVATFGGQVTFNPVTAATAGATRQNSITELFRYSYWNGSAAITTNGYSLVSAPSSAAASVGDLVFYSAGTTEKMRLTAAGHLTVVGDIATGATQHLFTRYIDTAGADSIDLGTANATGVNIGRSGYTTTIVQAPWVEVGSGGAPAFDYYWGNYGAGTSTAAFFKDSCGIVHIKGTVGGGKTGGYQIFILPAGYRPAGESYFACAWYDTNLAAYSTYTLDIDTAGYLFPNIPDSTMIMLDGITFRAA